MALTQSTHLFLLDHKTKGWNLYKSTIQKGGKLITETYRKQAIVAGKLMNVEKKITTQYNKNHKQIKESVTRTATAMKKGAAASNDLMKALKRAAVVAPVWLALRSVMMKVIRTITDGHKAWAEWDKALIKAKAVIHTTSMDISSAYIRLQDEVEKLSLKTGISLDKITNAFFRFGTLGIDFEESLAGMNAAVNISLALGGNLEQVVRPLAFAYDLLGDTMDQTIPVSERLEQLGSKMFGIWKINAFEIDGFSQALINFLPTANAMNFSFDETLALLAAMSSSAILAGRGGRLLRQSVLRLTANMGKLASQLGLFVNPQLESSNEILLKVLKRIKELGESGTVEKAGEALTAIFGGARMGEAARGLISVFDLIQENIDITSASGDVLDKQMKAYADRLKEVEDSLHRQLEIGKQLSTQLGRVFLKGIFGGDEFAETIKNINKAKKGMLPIIELIAKTTKDYFVGGVTHGSRYLAMLQVIRKETELAKVPTPEEAATGMKFRPELGRYTTEWTEEDLKTYKEEETLVKRIKYENQIKLNLLEESLKITKLEAKGLSKSQVAYKKLTAEVRERVKQFNELDDLEKLGYEKLKEKQILLLLEGREHEKILALTNDKIIGQDKLNQLAKMQVDYESAAIKERQSAIKLLVAHEMNLLKIKGASNRQIIEATMAMNEQLGINNKGLALLKNQLALEKEITNEKTNQTKISSESVKLYEISQKYGISYAKELGKWLRGLISLKDTRLDKTKQIAEEYFKSRVQAEKAIRFFKESGVFGGRGILTKEKATARALAPKVVVEMVDGVMKSRKIPRVLDIQKRAEEILPKISMPDLKLPAITTNIAKIEINVRAALKEALSEQGISKNILDSLAEAIKTNPKITEAIDERIEKY